MTHPQPEKDGLLLYINVPNMKQEKNLEAIWLGKNRLIRVQSTCTSTYRQGCQGRRYMKITYQGILANPNQTWGMHLDGAAPNPNGQQSRLTKGP